MADGDQAVPTSGGKLDDENARDDVRGQAASARVAQGFQEVGLDTRGHVRLQGLPPLHVR